MDTQTQSNAAELIQPVSEVADKPENLRIMARIDEVFATHKTVRESIQAILIDCAIKCADESHDIRYAQYLVQKAEQDGGGMRCEDIVKWLNEYASVEVKYEVQAKKHMVKYRHFDKAQSVDRLNKGKSTIWYAMTKAIKPTEWDAEKAVNMVIQQASNMGKKRAKLEAEGKTKEADLIKLNGGLVRGIKAVKADPRIASVADIMLTDSAKAVAIYELLVKLDAEKADQQGEDKTGTNN